MPPSPTKVLCLRTWVLVYGGALGCLALLRTGQRCKYSLQRQDQGGGEGVGLVLQRQALGGPGWKQLPLKPFCSVSGCEGLIPGVFSPRGVPKRGSCRTRLPVPGTVSPVVADLCPCSLGICLTQMLPQCRHPRANMAFASWGGGFAQLLHLGPHSTALEDR